MSVFDSPIPENYELLKVITIQDFKSKDVTFGLVFRPSIKDINVEKQQINNKQDKEIDSTTLVYSNKQRDYSAIISYFALAKLD